MFLASDLSDAQAPDDFVAEGEEAAEVATAERNGAVIHEAADVLSFTLVTLAARGVELADLEAELDRRSLRLTRRRGDAKPAEAQS